MSKLVKGFSWFKRLFPDDKAEILPTIIVTGGAIVGGIALAIWKDFNYPKIYGKQQPQLSGTEMETGRQSMPPTIGPAMVGNLQSPLGPKATMDNRANRSSSDQLKKDPERPKEVISPPKGLETVLPQMKQEVPQTERPPPLTKPRTIPSDTESTVPARTPDHTLNPKAM